VFTQVPQTAHDPVEGGLAALVDPVGVVQLAWTVHGKSDQEVVVPEESGPFVVDERAVGLDGVDDPPTGRGVSPLDSTDLRKKSRPISMGSPPCQATVISGAGPCDSISWRM